MGYIEYETRKLFEKKNMTILLYSREPLKTRTASILAQNGIETIDVSSTANLNASLGRYRKPQLALIDKKAEDAVIANDFIKKLWNIPTVLIIEDEKEAWQDVEKFQADGYVQDSCSNQELVLRLSAIYRRVKAVDGNEVNS
jgi:AmiR/NasT family two-component response regulator